MSRRKIYDGLPLPDFLMPKGLAGTVLEVNGVSKSFGGIRAVNNAGLTVGAGEIHALIGPNGAGKTTLFNLVSGLFPTDKGTIKLNGREIQGVPSDLICHQGLARSFQITNLFKGLSIYENLRLSLQAQQRHALQPLARHRQLREHPRRDRGADQIPRARRASRPSRAANSPMAGSGWSISASRSAPSRRCCCSTNRWRALPPPSASACRTSSRTSPPISRS